MQSNISSSFIDKRFNRDLASRRVVVESPLGASLRYANWTGVSHNQDRIRNQEHRSESCTSYPFIIPMAYLLPPVNHPKP
ncbi:hypothetical protein [Nostoc punctiforme]|uniref:hypothetical protein n=1 Tax=Nostoc punctiforme TaxID=272131 RepID=UPI000045BFE4|nr:hypothetical protein [Nostoc punctiforme]